MVTIIFKSQRHIQRMRRSIDRLQWSSEEGAGGTDSEQVRGDFTRCSKSEEEEKELLYTKSEQWNAWI